MLKFELDRIRKEFPHASIIYSDYYNSAMRFYLHPHKYGMYVFYSLRPQKVRGDVFTCDNVVGFARGGLAACCPRCGPYKVDEHVPVGGVEEGEGAKACEDPSEYVSWDGLHLTEAAYGVITEGLVKESFTLPQTKSFCANYN